MLSMPPGTEIDRDGAASPGRIQALIRNSGMFIDLHDASGKIQVFGHKDHLSPDGLATLKLLDIGDLIGVEGQVRRYAAAVELTTVNAAALTVLAKGAAAAAREISSTASPISTACATASAMST